MAEEGGTVFPPQVTQVETEAQMKSPKLAQGHLLFCFVVPWCQSKGWLKVSGQPNSIWAYYILQIPYTLMAWILESRGKDWPHCQCVPFLGKRVGRLFFWKYLANLASLVAFYVVTAS